MRGGVGCGWRVVAWWRGRVVVGLFYLNSLGLCDEPWRFMETIYIYTVSVIDMAIWMSWPGFIT